jgi:hypothetical protein
LFCNEITKHKRKNLDEELSRKLVAASNGGMEESRVVLECGVDISTVGDLSVRNAHL